jgi:hypothetical protein
MPGGATEAKLFDLVCLLTCAIISILIAGNCGQLLRIRCLVCPLEIMADLPTDCLANALADTQLPLSQNQRIPAETGLIAGLVVFS